MRIEPYRIIRTLKRNDLRAGDAAKELGVHRSTIHRWAFRARQADGSLSERGLKRRSTKPHRTEYALSISQKPAIISLREAKGYTSLKIKRYLNLKASAKTIERFLKKRGLIKEAGYYRRPRYQETRHMHLKNTPTIGYLQMDVKYITPELSGLPWTAYEYAIVDIFSRYKEAVILNQLDHHGSLAALLEILPRLPFKPVFLQTDNGLEFQGRFPQTVKELGIRYHFVHKSSPNENAVVERTFRTDEEEFFFRMPRAPRHYDELRNWFAQYLWEYNYKRPHLGIDLKTPAEVVANVMSH